MPSGDFVFQCYGGAVGNVRRVGDDEVYLAVEFRPASRPG